jgi:hypothetical protein
MELYCGDALLSGDGCSEALYAVFHAFRLSARGVDLMEDLQPIVI